nr:hypothetical protein [Tanacetum cinerariifolium]
MESLSYNPGAAPRWHWRITLQTYYVKLESVRYLAHSSEVVLCYVLLTKVEDSSHRDYTMNQATVQDGRVVVHNVQGRSNRGQGMNPQGGSSAGYGEAQNRVGNVNQGQARLGQARNAEDCDAFDSDVDEASIAQTMFMANLSSADPITDEVGPSYESDILSE